jgi:hypothetical protein
MGFLDLAKQLLRAESDESDQSRGADDLLSHTALLSQARRVVDGCELHGVTSDELNARWQRVEAIIAATPEDDHDAQWSVVTMCPCCCGPARVEALLCSRCDGADLDELRKVPPCTVCGGTADRLDSTGAEWRCEPHATQAPR